MTNNGQSTLVLQSFGRESEYRRAILCILSYFAHTSASTSHTGALLFTDNPGYFTSHLAGLPVEYVLLTPEKIRIMRGRIDFLHRMKIAVIEEAFGKCTGNLLYADSDTFFTADPEPLVRQLTPLKSFMHVWEYEFASLSEWPLDTVDGRSFRFFLDLIEKNEFVLANNTRVSYTPTHVSWNAGVMFFHPAHAAFLPDVYALTEQFYPPTLNHASEQYAFSLILQERTELAACDAVIYHYWYRVKKQIVDHFLAGKMNAAWSGLSTAQKLLEVKAWTRSLPALFETHIFMARDNAIQAFNKNQFQAGYRYALKALLRAPFHTPFIKDVLYHTRRHLAGRKS